MPPVQDRHRGLCTTRFHRGQITLSFKFLGFKQPEALAPKLF
jgi:hypothetical protein